MYNFAANTHLYALIFSKTGKNVPKTTLYNLADAKNPYLEIILLSPCLKFVHAQNTILRQWTKLLWQTAYQ